MTSRILVAFFFTIPLPLFGQESDDSIPKEIEQLFQEFDQLGRDQVKDARFVELVFDDYSDTAWLLKEDENTVIVMRDDFLPWTYLKNKPTQIPSSWHPKEVILKKVNPADFEKYCKELENKQEKEESYSRLRAPLPSNSAIAAHAAWKKGFQHHCMRIIKTDPHYKKDNTTYTESVRNSLAWLHYLRGVNLLMFADRQEVLPHLRLVKKLSPQNKLATSADDLRILLEQFIADKRCHPTTQPESRALKTLPASERATMFIQQLPDLHCIQFSQPGWIDPYVTPKGEILSEDTPSTQLRKMGYDAVPGLIEALTDQTPTRTVYHWRDFSHNRLVWRVSDFAWHILRDISGREFGYQNSVGFTYSNMNSEEQSNIQKEIQIWHEKTKNLSPDERMMTFFSSNNFDDWITAGQYFAEKKDSRAIPLLLEKLPIALPFQKGELCEVIASFGDKKAIEPIRTIMKTGKEPSTRIQAAIALWELGDTSGIPVAIDFVLAEEQPYGSWDTPIWFLAYCNTDESMAALKQVVTTSKPRRIGEAISMLASAVAGDLHGEHREPAGSVRLAGIFIEAMGIEGYSGEVLNDVRIRIKDQAATGLAAMLTGVVDSFGPFVQSDPKVFNLLEPDVTKRDAQIESLIKWYTKNRDKLEWDKKNHKLKTKK